ncbi:hypothetical protein DFA_06502 [Cavenderia fasciculata]|uniref:SAM domain-containing protein n=1 Tax=Cavenderia fasciculata TaxID=261658 RepID=F4PJ66_CACFS|nr:uncharacterized protein DFA_06502 [Cavenderia fasciculata]EGG24352.1 hypothetical protein DFA_06502 [Cavenderia fasciculata]|eukprot:XP_004362203.1 hypothetical protein DFA_06502 [Cavenderia fasciculata]
MYNALTITEIASQSDFKRWSAKQVKEWATKEVQVREEYAQMLLDNDVDGESIAVFTEADFGKCGIVVAPAKKLYLAVQQLLIQQSLSHQISSAREKRAYDPPIKESLQKYKKSKAFNEMYPQDPLCSSSLRTRFKFVDGLIHIMDRKITSDLLEDIKKSLGKVKGFYVQGPQGVGKSHSLYQVIAKDGEILLTETFFFLDIALVAFEVAGDNFVQDWTSKLLLDVSPQGNLILLDQFLHDMAAHCRTNNLSIYMVFDQHHSLTDEQRLTFPLCIIEGSLVTSSLWSRLLVVISGSANNRYALKVATDGQWPIFPFNNGFTDDEYNKWAITKKIINDQDTFDKVKSVTSFIPVEVQQLLDLDTTKDFSQVDNSIFSYTQKKRNQITLQDIAFQNDYLGDQRMQERFIRSILFMELNLPIQMESIFINHQLMVLRDGYVCPLIPMVVPILKSAYSKTVPYDINLALIYQSVFRGTIDLTSDARGRIVEHYLIDKLSSVRKFSVLAKKINIVTKKRGKQFYDNFVLSDQKITVKDYHTKEFCGNNKHLLLIASLVIVGMSQRYFEKQLMMGNTLHPFLIFWIEIIKVTDGALINNDLIGAILIVSIKLDGFSFIYLIIYSR